jgi:predicted RNase H-like nuclease (RuvC/YqgF family)
MGFKIAAVSTGLLLIVTTGLWFFVQMQAKEIATLKANAIILEDKIEEQNASIDNYLAKQKETTEQINQLNAQNQEAMREVNQLRNTFQRHSLNNLAMAKPGLIENIINKGTAKVKTEFLELTDPNMFESTDEAPTSN